MADNNDYREQMNSSEVEHSADEINEIDDSESELTADNVEEYEEKATGIKLKYVLEENEIIEIFKHTENYQKNCKLQKNSTIVQIILLLMLILLWILRNNIYYGFMTILPLGSMGIIWGLPYFSLKRLAKEFYSGEEVRLSIFPDRICMEVKDKSREILLDGTAEFEEVIEMLIITPKDQNTLIIPLRAIESEFLPDIQAMITAGTVPKQKN